MAIINHDWQSYLDRQNVDKIKSLITQSFINPDRQFIPNKIKTIRMGDQPWYTNLLCSKMCQRVRLFKNDKLNNNKQAWLNITELEINMFIVWHCKKKHTGTNKLISNVEIKYIGGRGWWRTIKHHIGNSKSVNMPALLLPSGEAAHDNISKASALNNFFFSHNTACCSIYHSKVDYHQYSSVRRKCQIF